MTDWQGRNKALERPWPSPVQHQSPLLLTFRPLDRMETADVQYIQTWPTQYMQRPILANTGKDQTDLCSMTASLRSGHLLDCTFSLSRRHENSDTSDQCQVKNCILCWFDTVCLTSEGKGGTAVSSPPSIFGVNECAQEIISTTLTFLPTARATQFVEVWT